MNQPALGYEGSPPARIDADVPQVVTCPECGQVATVMVTRRDAQDFCRRCDFPLFWTPSEIQIDRAGGLGEASLRRLPGTVGRATLASQICPHCAEPNAVSATVCLRCGRLLHVIEAPPPLPPEPEPVVVVPEPVYEEPDNSIPWWVWVLVTVVVSVVVVLIVLTANHTINWG